MIWTLRKGPDRRSAELRTHAGGVELQLLFNGEWYYGRRHEARELALAEADFVKADFVKEGWSVAQFG